MEDLLMSLCRWVNPPVIALAFMTALPALGETKVTSINDDDDDAEVVSKTDITQVQTGQPEQAAGTEAPRDSVGHTEITQKEVLPSPFRDEAVGIKPQFGLISLDDAAGS